MKDNPKILIYAPSIVSSGGRALIEALISLKEPQLIFYLSEALKQNSLYNYFYCKKGLLNRLKAEIELYKISKDYDLVLTFGNNPPLLKLKCRTFVFIQNKNIFSQGISHFIQRAFHKFLKKNYQIIIVQTAHMKDIVSQYFPNKPIKINSFLPRFSSLNREKKELRIKYDFIYVATGVQSKNHKRLLMALKLVKEYGINPSVCFTLDESYSELKDFIDSYAIAHDLNISNIYFTSDLEKEDLYRSSKALIHPSYSESFCLPLFEAQKFGIDILASELDHVREVIDPVETFDPYSEVSISRAILRYFNIRYHQKNDYTANSFINNLKKYV